MDNRIQKIIDEEVMKFADFEMKIKPHVVEIAKIAAEFPDIDSHDVAEFVEHYLELRLNHLKNKIE